jgi:hypothetical protein
MASRTLRASSACPCPSSQAIFLREVDPVVSAGQQALQLGDPIIAQEVAIEGSACRRGWRDPEPGEQLFLVGLKGAGSEELACGEATLRDFQGRPGRRVGDRRPRADVQEAGEHAGKDLEPALDLLAGSLPGGGVGMLLARREGPSELAQDISRIRRIAVIGRLTLIRLIGRLHTMDLQHREKKGATKPLPDKESA